MGCCRKWRLISHPDTVNPFLASFVNYTCTLHLHPITVGNQTFFDWRGERTSPQHPVGCAGMPELRTAHHASCVGSWTIAVFTHRGVLHRL